MIKAKDKIIVPFPKGKGRGGKSPAPTFCFLFIQKKIRRDRRNGYCSSFVWEVGIVLDRNRIQSPRINDPSPLQIDSGDLVHGLDYTFSSGSIRVGHCNGGNAYQKSIADVLQTKGSETTRFDGLQCSCSRVPYVRYQGTSAEVLVGQIQRFPVEIGMDCMVLDAPPLLTCSNKARAEGSGPAKSNVPSPLKSPVATGETRLPE